MVTIILFDVRLVAILRLSPWFLTFDPIGYSRLKHAPYQFTGEIYLPYSLQQSVGGTRTRTEENREVEFSRMK